MGKGLRRWLRPLPMGLLAALLSALVLLPTPGHSPGSISMLIRRPTPPHSTSGTSPAISTCSTTASDWR